MSLQVWLPLNGDLHNQGLSGSLNFSTVGTVTNVSGKIGQAKHFSGARLMAPYSYTLGNEFSFTAWIKWDSFRSDNDWIIELGNTSSGYANALFGLSVKSGSSSNTIVCIGGKNVTSLTNNFVTSEWFHVAVTWNGSTVKLYSNGLLIDSKALTKGTLTTSSNLSLACNVANSSTKFTGSLNDVRIYDHCLSTKEVEEISKGLVLHYKLDQNTNVLNNCYNYPTFNTSSATGGWSHWGPSGHSGKYSQNTDKQFIYNKNNTYSHCVDNTASATGKYYLCYQSPAFEGGYRSLQCIVKEANGQPITESICVPGWNARNGGAPSNIWTRITSLGDGFYWCEVDGISQDGSNDLVSITVQPGYKIYISEAYLENDRKVCSNIFNQDNLNIIYDCSGYNNNGIANQLTTTSISARYKNGIVFSGSSSYVKTIENKWMAQYAREMTINLWAKAATWPTSGRIFSCTETGGFNTEAGSSGYWRFPIYVCTNEAQTSYAYKYDSQEIQISALPVNEWVMLTFVYDSTGTRTYINGELHHTYTNTSYGIRFNTNARLFLGCEANSANPSSPYFNGQESDFRIYYTALTPEQILELYNTSATIDNKGNIYSREYIENNKLNITKTGLFQCNKIYDDDELTVASIVKSTQQVQGNTIYEY